VGKVKRYDSRIWLVRQLFRLEKTPEQIAVEQQVAAKTIYRKIEQFRIRL
jgi:hypothetical protein